MATLTFHAMRDVMRMQYLQFYLLWRNIHQIIQTPNKNSQKNLFQDFQQKLDLSIQT